LHKNKIFPTLKKCSSSIFQLQNIYFARRWLSPEYYVFLVSCQIVNWNVSVYTKVVLNYYKTLNDCVIQSSAREKALALTGERASAIER
jgi:hypothetical protein